MGEIDSNSRPKHWYRWVAYAAALLLIAALPVWLRLAVPNLLRLPDDLSYKADVISYDNFYDKQSGGFSGEVLSETDFYYEATSHNGRILNVKNVFDVREPTGERIFAVERHYGVDDRTGAHILGAGDKDRTGYLFAPRHLSKQPFTYWHINYDAPALMSFSDEERILGLNTYHYVANYHADQTANLSQLPGVGKDRGIDLDIKLDLWLEPLTGYLIKYEDHATAYYYDLKTHKRLLPWNQFHNRYSFDSIATHVEEAKRLRQESIAVDKVVPWTMVVLASLSLLAGSWSWWRRLRPSRQLVARYAAVAALVISTLSLIYWLFGANAQALSGPLAPVYPIPALSVMILALALWAASVRRLAGRQRTVWAIMLVLLAAWCLTVGAVSILGLSNGGDTVTLPRGTVPLMPSAAAICLGLLAASLLMGWYSRRRWFGLLGELFTVLVLAVGLFGVFAYSYGESLGWLRIVDQVRPLAALTVVLLATSWLAMNPSWHLSKALERLGKGRLLFVLVLMAMLLVTSLAWQLTANDSREKSKLQFETNATSLKDKVVSELDAYIGVLYGAQSLFAASNEVERGEWAAYAGGLRLNQNYPGMQALGFVQIVPQKELQKHMATIRSQGFSDYTVKPLDPPRDLYTSVIYIEPFDVRNQRAFGFDMLSEPIRQAAMLQARNSGQAAMSGKVKLVQETDVDVQAGFLVYIPIYTRQTLLGTSDQRAAAIYGYVYSPFRMNNFMRAAVGEQTQGIEVEVYDYDPSHPSLTDDSNRMFSNISPASRHSPLVLDLKTEVAGHSWLMRFAASPSYVKGNSDNTPSLVLAAGTLLSFLLAATVYALAFSRQRAVTYAKLLTADLADERDRALRLQQKDETLIGAIAEGLIVFSRQGKIERINAAALDLLGYSESEVVGQGLDRVLVALDEAGRHIPTARRPATRVLESGQAITDLIVQYQKKSGEIVPAKLSIAPIKHQAKVIGAIEIFRDITKDQQLDKAKDEFLSIASHQLRTPLTAEKWYLEILIGGTVAGKLNKKQLDITHKVNDSNSRLARLISSLLNVTRADSGRLTVSPVPTDMASLVKGVIDEVQPRLVQKKQTIELTADKLPKIKLDALLIRQVVMNLLTNAIKYSPDGKPVFVSLKLDGEHVKCAVRDLGYGIPADQQDRVFSKFFRGENIISQATEGNGLGLYLVKSIVELSGGRIQFVSKQNEGTTFAFSLPLKGSRASKGEVTLEKT